MNSIIDDLKKDIVVPDIVLSKTEEIFERIKQDKKDNKWNKKKSISTLSRLVASIVVCVLAFSVITVGATAYFHWSKGLEEDLEITENQKVTAQDSGLADFMNQSVTKDGITITAEQSIVDNYFAYLSFKVEGYNVDEDVEPAFGSLDISVGDNQNVSASCRFYSNSPEGSYKMDDGSYEYHIILYSDGEKELFLNQPISIQFNGIGYYEENLDIVTQIDETWKFEWVLKGDDNIYYKECNSSIGDSDVVLSSIEISPISIRALLDILENKEIPVIYAVKLKDGTIYKYITNAGSQGYVGGGGNKYELLFSTTRILEVDQVESIIFITSVPEGEEEPNEENLTEVDIR